MHQKKLILLLGFSIKSVIYINKQVEHEEHI